MKEEEEQEDEEDEEEEEASLGVAWTHWAMLVMTAGGVVLLLKLRLSYQRLELDRREEDA